VRVGAAAITGVVAVAGVMWISRSGPTDTSVATEVVRLGATDADQQAGSFEPADLFAFGNAAPGQTIVVQSASGDETLAGALMVRDGYLVTSGAALGGADDVLISWGDLREPGRVVGYDAVTDMTVIHVPGLTADHDHTDALVAAGDEVIMPGDDGTAATQKVVAAASTSAWANGDPLVGIVELDGRIGDVAPGTPAYDMNGDVVGITTATAETAPTAIIPISLAREVASEIIDDGEATHPWLGVRARNPESGDDETRGSLVTAVTEDGPAADGGVIEGDLITRIDDQPVDSMAAMVATLRSYEPGDVVNILVERDGAEVGCTVALASHLDVGA